MLGAHPSTLNIFRKSFTFDNLRAFSYFQILSALLMRAQLCNSKIPPHNGPIAVPSFFFRKSTAFWPLLKVQSFWHFIRITCFQWQCISTAPNSPLYAPPQSPLHHTRAFGHCKKYNPTIILKEFKAQWKQHLQGS